MTTAQILVVEDESIIAMEIQDTLERLDYSVPAVADTGPKAIAQAVQTRPDLVLMDIRLKGEMDGVTAATHIREQFDIPIIYLTAYADDSIIQRAKITEPFGYIIKPFTAKELATAIEMALYKHQIEQKLKESEQRFRAAAQATPDAIISIDSQHNIIFWNQSAEKIFGYSADEAVGRPLYFIMPARFRDVCRRGLEQAVSSGQTKHIGKVFEQTGLRKNGREFPLEVSLAKWQVGQELFFTAIIRDITRRKQTQEERQKLSNTIEQTADSVIITDREGVIEYVNPAFTQITGYTQAEALGQTPRLLKSGRHRPKFYKNLWQTILAGQVFQGIFINRRKNGQVYYEERTINSLKDEQGHLTHFVSTGRDITEQRLAQLTLKENALRLAEAQRIAHLGNWEYDFTTGQEIWSDEAYRICGLKPQPSIEHQTFLNLVHPDDKDFVINTIDQAVKQLKPYNIEYRLIQSRGSERYVHAQARITFNKSGRPKLMIGTLQDITERKLAELENVRLYAETQQWAKELAALNKAGRAMTSSLNMDRVLEQTLTEVNETLRAEGSSALLRHPTNPEALVFAAASSPGAEKFINATVPLANSLAGWVVQNEEPLLVQDVWQDPRFYQQIDAQSGLTTRSLLAVPLLFKEEVIGVIEVINKIEGDFDLHDLEVLEALASSAAIAIKNARLYEAEREQYRRLQQSQAQLIRVEKMAAIGRLVGSIAHEINNPIQAVQNCLALLKEEVEGRQRPDKIYLYADIAKNELNRVATIVRRMRDFYRPSPQPSTSDPVSIDDFYRLASEQLQVVNLPALIEDVLQLTNKQLQYNKIKVERAWSNDLPAIQGSPDHLKQVFLNLVLNAMDAMLEQGGVLHLRLRPDQAELLGAEARPVIHIEFSDTGVGIPPDILPRLFEPLFTTKTHGTGFGLFTCFKIIEAHHGQITAQSQAGAGTTITILLPLE